MDYFSGRIWRIISSEGASCYVYEMPKQKRHNIKICLSIGPISTFISCYLRGPLLNNFHQLFSFQCRRRPHRRLHHSVHRPWADAIRGSGRRIPDSACSSHPASSHGPNWGSVPVLLPCCPRVPVLVWPVISRLTDVRPGIRCLKSSRHPASCHEAYAPLRFIPIACKLIASSVTRWWNKN